MKMSRNDIHFNSHNLPENTMNSINLENKNPAISTIK